MKQILTFIILFCLTESCKTAKEFPEPIINPETGESVKTSSFTIQFQLMNGSQPFEFEKNYVNEYGEIYRINHFKFFISNILLSKPDGSTYSVPSSYFLVNPMVSEKIKVDKIPVGSYSSISYDIGIDSARNVSGIQNGALDPANAPDMFWNWNTGYVFLMLNGTSPASALSGNNFQYHISGFRKVNNAIQTVSDQFGLINMEMKPNAIPNLHYYVNLDEFFKNPETISISRYPEVTAPGSDAAMISLNYKDMFVLQHIEN